MIEKPLLLRAADVCSLLSISEPTLYRWIRAGNFPRGIKYGDRCVAWERSTLDAWLASKKQAASAPSAQ